MATKQKQDGKKANLLGIDKAYEEAKLAMRNDDFAKAAKKLSSVVEKFQAFLLQNPEGNMSNYTYLCAVRDLAFCKVKIEGAKAVPEACGRIIKSHETLRSGGSIASLSVLLESLEGVYDLLVSDGASSGKKALGAIIEACTYFAVRLRSCPVDDEEAKKANELINGKDGLLEAIGFYCNEWAGENSAIAGINGAKFSNNEGSLLLRPLYEANITLCSRFEAMILRKYREESKNSGFDLQGMIQRMIDDGSIPATILLLDGNTLRRVYFLAFEPPKNEFYEKKQ